MDNSFDILIKETGGNGSYQKNLVSIAFLFWFGLNFISVSIPYLELNRKVNYYDHNQKLFVHKTLDYDFCESFIDYKDVTIDMPSHSWTIEFGIECDKYRVNLISSCHFTGVMIGSLIFQCLSDSLGRKATINISALLYSISLILFCLIKDINIIFINMVFNQIFTNICILATYMKTLEMVSTDKRSFYGAIINSAFSISGIFFICSYKTLNNWRVSFYLAAIIIIFTFLIFDNYAVESPRYNYLKKDISNFYENLNKIAHKNSKENEFQEYLAKNEGLKNRHLKFLVTELIEDLPEENILIHEDEESNESKYGGEIVPLRKNNSNYFTFGGRRKNDALFKPNKLIRDFSKKRIDPLINIFTHNKIRINFIITCYLWLSTAGIYFALGSYIKNFTDNIYGTGIIIYIFELFAYLFSGFIIETKLGRKYSLITLETISFLSCIIISVVNFNDKTKCLIAFGARLSVSAIYNIIYTYSLEIFPTFFRAKGYGFNAMFEAIGEIIFPILMDSFNEKSWIIFIVLNFIAVILPLFLPETRGIPLDDHLEE